MAACDICWIKGEKNGLSALVTCRTCKVSVHPECYELGSDEEKRKDFKCWACQSVGTTVKFRERDGNGNRVTKTITARPTDCCLCGTPDAQTAHAMHPLFDDYGQKARQIKLENDEPAWVHTLCALVVAKETSGLVYACDGQGYYEGPQGKDDTERIVYDDDDSSVNSQLASSETDDGTHHYVYVMERWYGSNQAHVKLAKEQQRDLRCQGCGKDDSGGNGHKVYRVALQCMANDAKEFKEFRDRDPHLVRPLCIKHGIQYCCPHIPCLNYSLAIAMKLGT